MALLILGACIYLALLKAESPTIVDKLLGHTAGVLFVFLTILVILIDAEVIK